ncbi:hypothetical protein [Megalodesulfovibrio paquesii]
MPSCPVQYALWLALLSLLPLTTALMPMGLPQACAGVPYYRLLRLPQAGEHELDGVAGPWALSSGTAATPCAASPTISGLPDSLIT